MCLRTGSNTEIFKHVLSMIFFFINYHTMNLFVFARTNHIYGISSFSVFQSPSMMIQKTKRTTQCSMRTYTLKILMDVWYVQTAKSLYFFRSIILVDRQSADATVILVNPSTKLFVQLICADQILFPSCVLKGLGS
jgi:hypothetical protein